MPGHAARSRMLLILLCAQGWLLVAGIAIDLTGHAVGLFVCFGLAITLSWIERGLRTKTDQRVRRAGVSRWFGSIAQAIGVDGPTLRQRATVAGWPALPAQIAATTPWLLLVAFGCFLAVYAVIELAFG